MKVPALDIVNTPDGPTFFIDNSRMENFMRCSRRGEYSIVHKRSPSGLNMALKFGECIHLALEYRYRYYGTGIVDVLGRYHMHQIVDKFYSDLMILKPDEYRTAPFAKLTLERYLASYPDESFHIVSHRDRPMVECSFITYLGTVNGIRIVWKGKIDIGLADEQNKLWVLDHKTTAMGGEYFAMDFTNSSQLKGYTYTLTKALGQKVEGAVVNALVCRKPTRTGKGFEFQRFNFRFEEDVLEEWRINLLHAISDFFHHHARGYFPMQTTQCMTKYGQCPFISVCNLSPSSREAWLYSGDFQDDTFDPLKKDKFDLAAIRSLPLPPDFSLEPTATEVNNNVDISKMLTDILGPNPTI